MSSTVATIRKETENVAGEIEQLTQGFDAVDKQLADLQANTNSFVARFAA
jgi:methyl-accepting chemotaxis protein